MNLLHPWYPALRPPSSGFVTGELGESASRKGNARNASRLPRRASMAEQILALDEEGVVRMLAALGFPFYDAQIKGAHHQVRSADPLEHGITGEVLVHLDHEALKDVGIHSVGQRLAILKAVYALKVQQNVPVEEGHYVPPCTSSPPRARLMFSRRPGRAQRWGPKPRTARADEHPGRAGYVQSWRRRR